MMGERLCFAIAFLTVVTAVTIENGSKADEQRYSLSKVLYSNLNDVQKACQIYGTILAKVLDLAGVPLLPSVVSRFTDVIVQLAGNKDQDMWTAIEERLETRIDSKVTHNHFGTLVSMVKKLKEFMKPESQLTVKDLRVHILTMKDQFLPQTFSYTSFDSKWATALPAYLTYMTAAYLQLIHEGKLDRCSLAKELQTIREDTIHAAKALFRARYRNFNGIKSYKAWPNYACVGAPCFETFWLSFEDGATGTSYSEPLRTVPSIFTALAANTSDFVWQQLVRKVNFFFTKEICLCENDCPKPIQRSEVYFPYPNDCFGQTSTAAGSCSLPCHAYDDGYMWCPQFTGNRVPENSLLFSFWDYCTKDSYFLKCMPVTGTKVFE